MTLQQYQQLYNLPSGLTNTQYTKEVLNIMNINGNKFTIKQINDIVESIKVPEIKNLKKHTIKINSKRYGIVKDIMKSTFNEWIQYESIIGISTTEEDTIKNLHKILAIYVRPIKRKFFMFNKIQVLDKIDINENENAMLQMDIQDALAINVFFYQHVNIFIKRIRKRYLNQLIQISQITPMENKLKK